MKCVHVHSHLNDDKQYAALSSLPFSCRLVNVSLLVFFTACTLTVWPHRGYQLSAQMKSLAVGGAGSWVGHDGVFCDQIVHKGRGLVGGADVNK